MQKVFDALASPVRREILWRVWEEELPASAIADAFELSAPTISQHLAILREAGLVTMRVDGTFRRYRAVTDAMPALDELLAGARTGWHFEDAGTAPGPQAPAPTGSRKTRAVVAWTELPCERREAFEAFSDPARLADWLSPDARFVDGLLRFSLADGLVVQGRLRQAAPPVLIVLEIDVAATAVPIPEEIDRASITFFPAADGCRVEVVQVVRNQAQARYVERAWGIVLARLAAVLGG